MSVAHILGAKGRNVVSVGPGETVEKIIQLLAEKRIGAVIVTHGQDKIAGIVSERDVVRHMATQGAAILKKTVDTIMTKKVMTCTEADSEQELMALMTAHRIRHLPVVKGEKLIGMISIGDVVKHRIEAIEREAEEMKAYIAGAA